MGKLTVLFALFLVPLAGFTQDSFFKFLIVYQGEQDSGLYSSLESSLLKTLPQVQLVPSQPGTEENRISFLAQRWSCDAILRVQTFLEGPKIRVTWSLDTIQDPHSLTQGEFTKLPGNWSDQAEIFWLSLASNLNTYLKAHGGEVPKAVEASVSQVTIHGVPGTLIGGMEGQPQLVGPEGALILSLTYPASYTFTGSNPSYRTEDYPLFLLEPQVELTLVQRHEKVWSVDGGLFGASFPYTAVSWFPLPGQVFLRAGFQQFQLGVMFNDYRVDEPKTESLLVSLPLWHLNLGAGIFFNNPEALVRYYFVSEVFMRLMTPKMIILEPVAPFGLRPLVGVEYRATDSFGLYLEAGLQLFFLGNAQAYLASKPRDGAELITFFDDKVGLESLVFALGARFYF